ncbi:MAG: hypothetical protein EKK53_21585 [Burkholderiales bacterium]|nr:MAG: hypothetical protein EKK53_21585 [Burkholderiales bacterium]
MTKRSTIGGQRPTTSIINSHSSGGTSTVSMNAASMASARAIGSGLMNSGVLSTLLNVTSGAGRVPLLAIGTVDATSRTIRLRVTVDGTVVFDATSSAIAANGNGIFAAGAFASAGVFAPSEPIVFQKSFKVEAAYVSANPTETDKLQLLYQMHRS